MSYARRNVDRRRRVLYTSGLAENEVTTAATRRHALMLREARKPTAAYGARVQRRLRGRWFALVPVSFRNLVIIASLLWGVALALSLAHYAAVSWPTLASNAELSRPFRLDRPDSFGRWYTTLLLALAAGVSLLIYQLRRYRIDDFVGSYRSWRLVIILCVVASLDSLVSFVDWSGALVDAAVGRRVALAGNDWVRIVVALGGAVLAMRLVAEVRRSRWSLVTMLLGWALLAIPVAAKWNLFEVNSLSRWMLVTIAPLWGMTTLFLSLGGYLRLLYREVRGVEDSASLAIWFQQLRGTKPQDDESDDAKPAPKSASAETTSDEAESGRRWWWQRDPNAPTRQERREAAREERQRLKDEKAAARAKAIAEKQAAKAALKAAKQKPSESSSADDASESDSATPAPNRNPNRPSAPVSRETRAAKTVEEEKEASGDDNVDAAAKKGKRGWFGWRKSAAPDSDADEAVADHRKAAAPAADAESEPAPGKRRRFSLRLRGASSPAEPAASDAGAVKANVAKRNEPVKTAAKAAGESEETNADEPRKPSRFGLGWFQKKKASEEEDSADVAPPPSSENRPAAKPPASRTVEPSDDGDEEFDDDESDDSGMSKAERRKLRKQMRRGGRAA